jgi:hypothetical protein
MFSRTRFWNAILCWIAIWGAMLAIAEWCLQTADFCCLRRFALRFNVNHLPTPALPNGCAPWPGLQWHHYHNSRFTSQCFKSLPPPPCKGPLIRQEFYTPNLGCLSYNFLWYCLISWGSYCWNFEMIQSVQNFIKKNPEIETISMAPSTKVSRLWLV